MKAQARKVEGWMGKGPRAWLALQALAHRRIIEVGVWQGFSTRIMADATRGRVWAVDHWQGTPHDPDQHALYHDGDAAFAAFRRYLRDHIRSGRVVPVRMSSIDAAAHLLTTEGATFDMAFIDADHSYDAVRADIAAYLPLLRGGTICGHDYKAKWPGVIAAVDDAFGARVRIGPASIWSVRL